MPERVDTYVALVGARIGICSRTCALVADNTAVELDDDLRVRRWR